MLRILSPVLVCMVLPAFAKASLPIIGWRSIDDKNVSLTRYLEAKDGGFTHLIQGCDSPDQIGHILSLAEKAGIKLIIGLRRDVKKMTNLAEKFTAAAKGSPALAYYFVIDEPHIRESEAIRDCLNRYASLDPKHPCYVNLFGVAYDLVSRNDCKKQKMLTGCLTYGEYMRKLYDVAPLKMISFDVYPVLSFKGHENGDLRLHGGRVFLKERWYETLEIVSAFARERKIPMFAFALSTAHRHHPGHAYPVPTIEHLRLQHYSNLAYGAQALEYFRYLEHRHPAFELVREMNKEIQARAYVFVGCEVVGVWHTGINVPIGTKRLKNEFLPPFVKSFSVPDGGTALVSWLRNNGREYLMVVNRDPNDDITLKAKFVNGVEFVRRDGSRAQASTYSDTFWLDPGDTVIFSSSVR